MAERMFTVPVTDVFDGLAHELTDEAFAAEVGVYVALCGAEVWPAGGTARIGKACPACLQLLLDARGLAPEPPVYVTVPEQSRGRARHRRPGRLHGLLSHGGRSSR